MLSYCVNTLVCQAVLSLWCVVMLCYHISVLPHIYIYILLVFPRGYFLKSFPQVDTSAKQRGLEIRVFPPQGELLKAIKPHLPACQLYRWQLGPNMWSTPTTKSSDPIVVTALRMGFQLERHRHTCGFACNCPEPEVWTTEASWQHSTSTNTTTVTSTTTATSNTTTATSNTTTANSCH